MKHFNEYELFPLHLEGTQNDRTQWTQKIARAYFNWFIENKQARINSLLKFLDYQLTENVIADLNYIGSTLHDLFSKNELFYYIHPICKEKRLTEISESLCYDFAVLCAMFLQSANPKLHWIISDSRSKRYHAYKSPVLVEFTGLSTERDLFFITVNEFGYYKSNPLPENYQWSEIYSNALQSSVK